MKTEVNAKATIRTERRKIFWRLYSLPWIISIVILTLISAGFVWVIKDLVKGNASKEIELIEQGRVMGHKEIRQEAIDNEVGIWVAGRYGEVDFKWLAITNETNEVSIAKIFEEREEREEREYLYTRVDHKFGKSIGLHLEESLVGSCRVVVQNTFTEYSDKSLLELETYLKDRLEDNIHLTFDGFETFHKIRE